MNAEINSGVIKDPTTFIDWITWTYFFRRLVKNPTYYNCKDSSPNSIKEYLNNLVATVFSELIDAKCIEKEDNSYKTTFLGKLAAFYYLKHTTLKHFNEKITNKMEF